MLEPEFWTSSFYGVSPQIPAHLQPIAWAVQQQHPGMGRRLTGLQDLVHKGKWAPIMSKFPSCF